MSRRIALALILLLFLAAPVLAVPATNTAGAKAAATNADDARNAAGGKVDLKVILEHTLWVLGGLAVVFGLFLALAAKKWHVKTDPRIEQVMDALAHAHCGACGYAGCEQYAEAVLDDPTVPPNLCTPAGPGAVRIIAELSGKEPVEREPHYARLLCGGGDKEARTMFEYKGFMDCRAAVLAVGGDKTCNYGCLGLGTCERACPFGAITINANHLPVVDESKCTGCSKCVVACPKHVLQVLGASHRVYVACRSKDKGAATRKACTVGCIGCGACVKVCPTGATHLKDNHVHIDYSVCTNCQACVAKCPTKAIVSLVGREQARESAAG